MKSRLEMKRWFLVLKGMAMGIAEVIPGVSGGTIAFITGIYEELIQTIKSFDLRLFSILRKGKFKQAWLHVNGYFLLFLLSGMIIGVLAGVFGVSHLLEFYQSL
jgi:putative membrane protein